MAKVTFEKHMEVMNGINKGYFEELEQKFRYIEEEETIVVSKGGLQKSLEFLMEENRSFGLVAKLGQYSTDPSASPTLEVCVRIREDGAWKDYFDGILVKEHEEEAYLIAKAAKPMIQALQEELEGTDVILVDQTNLPLERWNAIKANRRELERCKRLYMLTQM